MSTLEKIGCGIILWSFTSAIVGMVIMAREKKEYIELTWLGVFFFLPVVIVANIRRAIKHVIIKESP